MWLAATEVLQAQATKGRPRDSEVAAGGHCPKPHPVLLPLGGPDERQPLSLVRGFFLHREKFRQDAKAPHAAFRPSSTLSDGTHCSPPAFHTLPHFSEVIHLLSTAKLTCITPACMGATGTHATRRKVAQKTSAAPILEGFLGPNWVKP